MATTLENHAEFELDDELDESLDILPQDYALHPNHNEIAIF